MSLEHIRESSHCTVECCSMKRQLESSSLWLNPYP